MIILDGKRLVLVFLAWQRPYLVYSEYETLLDLVNEAIERTCAYIEAGMDR